MKRLNVIVDVDDVLRDFVPAVIKKYNEVYYEDMKLDDIVSWELINHATKIDSLHSFVQRYPGELLIYSEKLPLAKEFMDRLHNNGYRVTIATHQFKDFEGFTYTWLQKNQIMYDNLFFGKDKYLLKGDIMIDDKYRNLQKFKGNNPGSLLLLMDKPWNREYPASYTDQDNITEYINLTRVKNLQDAYRKVLRHAKNKNY